MSCSCSSFGDLADEQFSAEKVAAEVNNYRKKGPGPTTRLLRNGLAELQLLRGDVIDVGGGFGALTHELLAAGMTHAVIVEASTAYLQAAREQAAQAGSAAAIDFVHGDFVAVAGELRPAALVTLDRVVCCYPSYDQLLQSAIAHAQRAVALSYPRGRWWVRAALGLENCMRRWRRNAFRAYVHPPRAMEQVLTGNGFALAWRRHNAMWSADVFVRHAPA